MPSLRVFPARRKLFLLGAAFVMATLPTPTPARADPAVASVATSSQAVSQVTVFYDALVSAMKDGPGLGFEGRVKRLTPAVNQAFDLPLMTKIAAGAQWPGQSADDQRRLVEAFSRFSVASYAANFDSYDGEQFTVRREVPAAGGGVIVETQLQPKKGDTVELNYLLRQGKSGLKIIDVFVNGTISELAARRSEFSAVLNSGGAPALYELMEAKTRKLSSLK